MTADTEKNRDTRNRDNPMQKLEEALVICGFGWFHVALLFATFCAVLASVLVTTTSSYILPVAECDLGMTIMQKGILAAMPFFGQVGVSLVTGFIIDAFGRKMFLVGGHIGIFVCTLLEGSSQKYWMLITGKFAEGIFLSVTFTASSVMVSECTHKNVRDRILLLWSSFMSISLIVAALLSWAVLPQDWNFKIMDNYELHTWNIYFYTCSIWSLLAAVIYYYLPESPKYLLSQGLEKESLEVLKTMYNINTKKDKNTFPITSLYPTESVKFSEKTTLNKKIVEALFEVKSLFRRPLFGRLLLFLFMNFISLFSYSPLRLWFPQISTIIENYQNKHQETVRFCVMIDDYTQGLVTNSSIEFNNTEYPICVPHIGGFDTYLSGIIMGSVALLCFCINGYLVKYVGQKPLLLVSLILCGATSGTLYWTNSLIQVAILLSATCAFMQAAVSLKYNILIRVFPTSVRSLSFSIVTMAGRIGSLLGSILFPIMLQSSCMSPFLTLLVVCLCVAGLVYLMPNPNTENNGTGDK